MQETRQNSRLYGKRLADMVNPIYREALPYLEKSYELNPNNEELVNALRDIYYKLGEAQKLQAIESRNQWLLRARKNKLRESHATDTPA